MYVIIAVPFTHTDCPSWEACLEAWHLGYEFITSYGKVFSVKDVLDMSRAGVQMIEIFKKDGTLLGRVDISNVGDIRYEKA